MTVNKLDDARALDEACLRQALACATQAVGLSEPNPRVGCVLLDAQGAFVAEGHTQQAGGPHAEALALRLAQAKGLSVRGGTAYVTLEPCSHQGRTPPCADALVASGVARVVVALNDPNPLVAGRGLARLREAGIAVEVLPPGHPVAVGARELNIGFLSRMTRQRPWVRLKTATSLDGRTALDNGDSQWITSPPARADGHLWRRRASAILSGIGTVLADNPQLNVRGVDVAKQPVKVVLDSHWRLPLDAALWRNDQAEAAVWVYGAEPLAPGPARRREALVARGAVAVNLPWQSAQAMSPGGLDLHALLADLAQRGINEVHVEAGAQLNASLMQGGWVDELLVYLAPKLLGPGRPMANLPALQTVSQAQAWDVTDVAQVGVDVRMVLRRPPAVQACEPI